MSTCGKPYAPAEMPLGGHEFIVQHRHCSLPPGHLDPCGEDAMGGPASDETVTVRGTTWKVERCTYCECEGLPVLENGNCLLCEVSVLRARQSSPAEVAQKTLARETDEKGAATEQGTTVKKTAPSLGAPSPLAVPPTPEVVPVPPPNCMHGRPGGAFCPHCIVPPTVVRLSPPQGNDAGARERACKLADLAGEGDCMGGPCTHSPGFHSLLCDRLVGVLEASDAHAFNQSERLDEYKREVERREEMLTASDAREAELRAGANDAIRDLGRLLDAERVRAEKAERERDAARADVERLRGLLREAYDRCYVQPNESCNCNTCGIARALWDRPDIKAALSTTETKPAGGTGL